MKRGYRAIAPAPPSTVGEQNTDSPGKQPESLGVRKRKINVLVACNNCRAKKVSCDGERPVCSRCKTLNRICHYVTTDKGQTTTMALKAELEEVTASLKQHIDVIERLRSAPEPEATAMLARLRSTPDVSAVLFALRTSIPPKRVSEHRIARAVLPATDTSVEFELMVTYKIVYPAPTPIDIFALDLDDLIRPESRSLAEDDAARSTTKQRTPVPTPEGNTIDPRLLVTESLTPFRGTSTQQSSVIGPSQSEHYCDARLQRLDLLFWTTIPISSDLAARTLSHYLETDHAHHGWFDAGLFLNDLVEHRLDHCSSFLVSSVLALACICYTGSDIRAGWFSHAFFREAHQVWKAERTFNTATTLAATNVLAMAAAYIGEDSISRDLVVSARVMAEEMKLFGIPRSGSETISSDTCRENTLKATAHVAWGTYCWLTFHATFFRGAPILWPPVLPIPGDEEGESLSDIRSQSSQLPDYMGHTFVSLCKLWVVVQEVLAVYTGMERPLYDTVALAFAESKYRKILALADTLSVSMALGDHSRSHVLIFQTLYHIAVLDIFRPFTQNGTSQRLRSFSSSDSSPDAIFNASFKQLKRLVLEYRMRFQGRKYSAWLNAAAQHVCNVVVHKTDDSTSQFYLDLCIGYWKESVTCFPVMTAIVKANLSLALSAGCMTGIKAQEILEEIESRARHHRTPEVFVSAIADFERAIFANDQVSIDELGQRFEMLKYLDNRT